MLLALSVLHQEWFAIDPLVPKPLPSHARNGLIAIVDWTTKSVLLTIRHDSPAGMCFTETECLVASMGGARISVVNDCASVARVIRDPLFSDLHTVTRATSGFLIASSGTDAVVEVAEDGRHLWHWLATAHGYGRLPDGRRRYIDMRFDYSMVDFTAISTATQTTHINSARELDPDTVLATLFTQGQLIAISRHSGAVEVLLEGMYRPHAVRRRPVCGWTICDSGVNSIVLLDDSFGVQGFVEGPFVWVQDALDLGNGNLLILDANNMRVVEWSMAAEAVVDQWKYPTKWKGFQIECLSPRWESIFRHLASQQ